MTIPNAHKRKAWTSKRFDEKKPKIKANTVAAHTILITVKKVFAMGLFSVMGRYFFFTHSVSTNILAPKASPERALKIPLKQKPDHFAHTPIALSVSERYPTINIEATGKTSFVKPWKFLRSKGKRIKIAITIADRYQVLPTWRALVLLL